MNACQLPVFLLMTGGSLLSFLVAWLWAAPKLKAFSQQIAELQKQAVNLQVEKVNLDKSVAECRAVYDLQKKQIGLLQNDLLKVNEENQFLQGENKMLDTRVKTLEVILKEIEDLNDN